jgi:hypothetical protein
MDADEHHLVVVVPRRSINQTSAVGKRKLRRSRKESTAAICATERNGSL